MVVPSILRSDNVASSSNSSGATVILTLYLKGVPSSARTSITAVVPSAGTSISPSPDTSANSSFAVASKVTAVSPAGISRSYDKLSGSKSGTNVPALAVKADNVASSL